MAMAKAMVNFRLDTDVKQNMEQVCAEIGLSMTEAFTVFAKTVIRERRIPFELTAEPFYSKSNLDHLRRGVAALNDGQGAEHKLIKVWLAEAWEDYVDWQDQDEQTLQRINGLIQDIEREPFAGIGQPEPHKGDLAGFWSRRIDNSNRLVYRVRDGKLEIISCKGHYDD
jgi:toxin YoeB